MDNTSLKQVEIWADGAAIPNPGFGGFGVLLVYRLGEKEHRKEICGGFRHTTNNRMELMAVLQGLKLLKQRCKVNIHTDSQYITNAFNLGRLKKWESKLWRDVKNVDLWQQLLVVSEQHETSYIWVKGHNGHPEQERSDYLANQGVVAKNLLIDFGYEQELARHNNAQNAQESLLTA